MVEITDYCFTSMYFGNIIVDTCHVQYFLLCEIQVIELVTKLKEKLLCCVVLEHAIK